MALIINNQKKSRTSLRVFKIVVGVLIFIIFGAMGYFVSRIFFAEAQVQILPPPTSPPLSCTGCHDSQGRLFTNYAHHHPNALASSVPTDMMTKVKAIRQDCCACHNYLSNHTRGIVLLKDPDPLDAYPYNGDPVLTNNFCLSCHDLPNNPANPPVWFSANGLVSPEHIIAPKWSLPCAHALNPKRNIRCLDCHKHHGSNIEGMLLLDQPQLCYMTGCHPEKANEFDPTNPSHHHIEGVLLGGVPTTVIACCDCHNPHHNTTPAKGYIVSDPYSTIPTDIPEKQSLPQDLYPCTPIPRATLPIVEPTTGLLVSGLPFYIGNTNPVGVPVVDLFCLECHAPDIFIPPNPPWPGAPNISFEINNKYYALGFTTSNFFYPHQHLIGSSCGDCHIVKDGTRPSNTLNGHFTHLKNASCTYCHDPHGTLGTFVGGTVSGIIGRQRGHLLKDWLLADSTAVNQLPYGGGYLGAGIYASTTITKVDGASSCFINDPLGGCHDITHIHKGGVISTNAVCNRVPCHLSFTPLLLRP